MHNIVNIYKNIVAIYDILTKHKFVLSIIIYKKNRNFQMPLTNMGNLMLDTKNKYPQTVLNCDCLEMISNKII